MSENRKRTYLSLRDRLVLNFVIFGVVIILIIGTFSYYTARDILLDRTFDQLTSVRVVKKRQIESFFADRSRDIKLVASSAEARELLKIVLNSNSGDGENAGTILNIYDNYLSRYLAAQDYFRYFYVFSKDGLTLKIPTNVTDLPDEKLLELSEGLVPPGLVELIETRRDIVIVDLDNSKNDPGLFIGAPLMEGDEMLGMIALEISIQAINKIMYENNPYEGLGESGESYLVGEDYLMRSISRFMDNSILNTVVSTPGVEMALKGIDSIGIFNDYRGKRVLSSFSFVDISGLHWVILAEIDLAEAQVPLNAIRNNILIISSFIVLFLFFAAVFLSGRITAPLIRLKNAAEKIGQGDFDTELKSGQKNEIGDLTHSFNTMTVKLADKTSELKKERLKRLRSVIDGQELERQRLSRELHDGLGQMLIALKLKMENIRTTEPCESMKMLNDVKASFDDTIDEIRRMSNDLMPAVLHEFGISTALRNLVEGVSENADIIGKFYASGKFEDLYKTTKTYLYRIAQEAVNNAVKHANASVIIVKIDRADSQIYMLIEDNGIGFEINNESVKSGNGLHNMRERTGLLQGHFEIENPPKGGTRIIVRIPMKNKDS